MPLLRMKVSVGIPLVREIYCKTVCHLLIALALAPCVTVGSNELLWSPYLVRSVPVHACMLLPEQYNTVSRVPYVSTLLGTFTRCYRN